MAHIVCITGGLTGIFNASLALVQQLQTAGHRVTYASPADFKSAIAAQGIPYCQLAPWIIQSGDPPMSRWQKLKAIKERQQKAVQALGVQNFVETMRSLSPDLLLIDMEMHPHIMAAVVAELPVALLCQFLSIWHRPNLPPIQTAIVPHKSWREGWLGIELSWWRYAMQQWWNALRDRWQRMGLDRRSVLRCHARKIGYTLPEQFGLQQWLLPFSYGSLPVFCLNAHELDFPHKPPANMHYLGPMVQTNRQENKVTTDTYTALENLFKTCQDLNKSLIYCACSTLAKTDQHFLQQLIKAVSTEPAWELVIGLGGAITPEQLGALPKNIHAFAWVPQLQVLKQAHCAINNGGINSINECIYLGVPMLIYSLKQFDQEGNAARAAYHGLGIAGDIRKDNAQQIKAYLQALLSHSGYRSKVATMRDQFHRYAQTACAAKAVGGLLQ